MNSKDAQEAARSSSEVLRNLVSSEEPTPLLELQVVREHPDAVLPSYGQRGDAGLDLHSVESLTLAPFERKLIATGIRVAIPEGYAGLILPRSGYALKHGLSIVNAPGLIDSNYRGEIAVIAYNSDPQKSIEIQVKDRVAQLLIQKVPLVKVLDSAPSDLSETLRGQKGFGSSGR